MVLTRSRAPHLNSIHCRAGQEPGAHGVIALSCLISWIQLEPEGGRSAGDGRQGSINLEGMPAYLGARDEESNRPPLECPALTQRSPGVRFHGTRPLQQLRADQGEALRR